MSTLSDYATSIQTLVAAIPDAVNDPATAVAMLSTLAASAPTSKDRGSITAAALCRRAAISALCRALSVYSLSSYDEARALLDKTTALIDAEIVVAGDAGQDAVYAALRRLRAEVTSDLLARGASLAPLIEVTNPQPLPSLVLAQKLYGDATRSDDIVARVDPIHPCFIGGTVRVLAR